MFPSCYILFGTAGPICGETNNRWYMYLVCCLFLVYHSQVSHLVLFHAFVVVTAISTGFFSFVCRWERPKQLNDHARVLGGFSFFLADVLRRLVSLERENIFLFFFFPVELLFSPVQPTHASIDDGATALIFVFSVGYAPMAERKSTVSSSHSCRSDMHFFSGRIIL